MNMFKRAGAALAGGIVAAWVGIAAQAAVVVSSEADLSDLDTGDTFTVTVATDADQAAFDGFQFDLTYDADVIGYTGAVFGPFFPTFTAGQAEPEGASGVTTVQNITGGIFDPSGTGLSGAITLVTLSFIVRDEGMTDITLSPTAGIFLSLLGNPVEGGGVFVLSAVVPTDDVAPVPVPAAALLFLPAVLGGAALRRRRSA